MRSIPAIVASLFLASLLTGMSAHTLWAQATPTQVTAGNDTGLKSFTTYSGSRENVNLTNGNLDISIPLVSLPGRNGHTFTLSMLYDSKNWIIHASPSSGVYYYNWQYESRPPQLGNLGWRLDIPCITGGAPIYDPDTGQVIGYGDYIITLPGGGKATVTSKGYGADLGDGSFINLRASNPAGYISNYIVTLKDGTKIYFDAVAYSQGCATEIDDPDGNVISFQYGAGSNYSQTIITDTVGRQITYDSITGSIAYKDSNGVQQTMTLNFGSYSLFQSAAGQYQTPQPPFSRPTQCPNCNPPRIVSQPGPNYGATLVSRVLLPTGKSYSFQYSGYGELIKINYPTGGYTAYEYTAQQHYDTYWIAPSTDGIRDFREVTKKRVCRSASGTCGTEDVTTYAPGSISASNDSLTVTDPASAYTQYQFSPSFADSWSQYYPPRETMRSVYSSSGTLLRTIQTDYISQGSDIPQGKFLPSRVTTTLNDASGGTQVTKTEYTYDTYSAFVLQPPAVDPNYQSLQYIIRLIDNVTQELVYGYGSGSPGSLLRQRTAAFLHVNPVNGVDYSNIGILHILDRRTNEQILDPSSNKMSETQYEYDSFTEGLTASGAVQHTSTYNTSYTTRGKVTAVKRWRNTDSTYLVTRNQYDDAGNLRKTTDPLNHVTTYSYTDSWGNSSCTPSGGNAAAYVTTVTNALSQATHATYNSCSGTAASATDLNGQVATYTYDLLNRVTQTTRPDTGQTTECYSDVSSGSCYTSSPPLKVVTTSKITATQNYISSGYMDGLGRGYRSELDSDPQGTDYTDITFDSVGRKATTTNPYRSTSSPTDGTTTFTYDALSRTTQVTPPDSNGSTDLVTTTYAGNVTTVTDQVGNQRRSFTDPLGRMIEVDEPGPSGGSLSLSTPTVTTYTYDVLGNLTQVLQGGSRQRTFTYNSLSQLLTAANPETGTITYTYDNDGNVLTKADARNITTTYSYDNIHRLTGKTYSNSDPAVSYTYDGSACLGQSSCYNIGRRASMTDAAGSESWSYDKMGRVLTDQRTTNSVTKSTIYSYNPDGSVATLTYPSGRAITYTPNTAGQTVSAVDSANSINYATNAVYTPHGELSSAQNGTNLVSTYFYNNRLQPCRISVKNTGSAPATCTDATTGNVLDYTYNFNLLNLA